MPDPTAAARSRRYRERKAKRLPPAPKVPCQACGRIHTSAHGDLCQRCWLRLTPEGRADLVARVLRSQKRKRDGL
jgi:hypothetical protein